MADVERPTGVDEGWGWALIHHMMGGDMVFQMELEKRGPRQEPNQAEIEFETVAWMAHHRSQVRGRMLTFVTYNAKQDGNIEAFFAPWMPLLFGAIDPNTVVQIPIRDSVVVECGHESFIQQVMKKWDPPKLAAGTPAELQAAEWEEKRKKAREAAARGLNGGMRRL